MGLLLSNWEITDVREVASKGRALQKVLSSLFLEQARTISYQKEKNLEKLQMLTFTLNTNR